MTKKVFLLLFTCLLLGQAQAQTSRYDSAAVSILDKMSRVMGDLSSVSATVKTNYDVGSRELGLVKHSDVQHVYVGGANKLVVMSEGDKGSKQFYYDGNTFSYYSVDRNQYAKVNAPSSIVDMIGSVHEKYGIVFPLADFLYPTFVDDILSDARSLELLGVTKVDGKDCFHIAGVCKDKIFQFWITDDAFYLPVKMVIIHTDRPMSPQFEATYCDWQINPVLPASIFEFNAPPGARKIKLTPLSEKNK
jgi:hypothetical protein